MLSGVRQGTDGCKSSLLGVSLEMYTKDSVPLADVVSALKVGGVSAAPIPGVETRLLCCDHALLERFFLAALLLALPALEPLLVLAHTWELVWSLKAVPVSLRRRLSCDWFIRSGSWTLVGGV